MGVSALLVQLGFKDRLKEFLVICVVSILCIMYICSMYVLT